MAYLTVTASKPGVSPPKVEKRTSDSIVMQVDVSSILNTNEVIHGEVVAVHPSDLVISEKKPVLGKFIRFRVEGGPINVPYTDYTIKFSVKTSNSNLLQIPVTIRAYST